jgi:hypothetical protein
VIRELPQPLQSEVPSIENLEGLVEKLRTELADVREAQKKIEEEE